MDSLLQLIGDRQLAIWALTSQQRIRALRDATDTSWPSWLGPFLIALLVLTALITALGLLAYRSRRQQTDRAQFDKQAESRGITPDELEVLRQIVACSGLAVATHVFRLEAAFDHGAAQYLLSDEFAQQSAEERSRMLALVESLQEKMEYGGAEEAQPAVTRTTRKLAHATPLTVFRTRGRTFKAQVTATSPSDIIIKPDRPVFCRKGEALRVHFAENQHVLEFQTAVLGRQNENIVLDHSDQIRSVNQRRFPRVQVRLPARAALFPLEKDQAAGGGRYVDARLIEVGGPGWKIESALSVQPGWRVLVETDLAESRIFQAIGIVQRVVSRKEKANVWVVELIALTEEEVARIVREANRAARSSQPDTSAA